MSDFSLVLPEVPVLSDNPAISVYSSTGMLGLGGPGFVENVSVLLLPLKYVSSSEERGRRLKSTVVVFDVFVL